MDTPPRIPDTPSAKERIRHAQMSGCASGLKGLVGADLERYAALKVEWPELAERIDRIIELVDWG